MFIISQGTSEHFSLMGRDEEFCLSLAKAGNSCYGEGKLRHRGAWPLHLTIQATSCSSLHLPPGSFSLLPGLGLKASSVISWMGWDQPRLWGDRRWRRHRWVSPPEGQVSGVMAAMARKGWSLWGPPCDIVLAAERSPHSGFCTSEKESARPSMVPPSTRKTGVPAQLCWLPCSGL